MTQLPAVDNAHVTEGLGLLTSRYSAQKIVTGITTALMRAIQEIENAYWSIVNGVQLVNHPQAGGPWDVLDKLGAIVGVSRNALSDANYVPQIQIKIRVNRSHGLAEDIIQVANLVAPGTKYLEWFPAAFEVDIFNTTGAIVAALIRWLGAARSAGTAGTLRYTLDANTYITWGSNTGAVAGQLGFGDSAGGLLPNRVGSLQALS
jgi:hypothetical protein